MYPFILFELNQLLPEEELRVPGFCVLIAMAISTVVVVKHIGNIKRILAGTEPKTYLFGKVKKASNEAEIPEDKPSKRSLHNEEDN